MPSPTVIRRIESSDRRSCAVLRINGLATKLSSCGWKVTVQRLRHSRKLHLFMCVWTSCGAQASTASGREWKDLAGCKNRRGRDIGYALAADSCEEAGSVDACTIAAPDAITAFAVPNPNCSSQSQSVFSGLVARQVSSPSGSPSLLQTSPMLLAPILSADVTYDHRTGDTGSQCRYLVHFADGKRTLHVPFGGKEKACGAGGLTGFGIFQLASFFCLRR